MNILEAIQERIAATDERIRECERGVREHPDYPSIAANLKSFQKRKRKLLREYEEAVAELKNAESPAR